MFDRVAPRYDRMNRVISLGLDRRWRRRTVDALGARAAVRACSTSRAGPATSADDLAARGSAPIGVDFSAGMLRRRAHRRAARAGRRAVLPVPDAAVDGVTCGFALRNFVDLDAVFAECARVLRPGGRFAALDAAVPEQPGACGRATRSGSGAWSRCSGGCSPTTPTPTGTSRSRTAYLPPAPELADRLAPAGFGDVEPATLTGGSVLLLTGTRA